MWETFLRSNTDPATIYIQMTQCGYKNVNDLVSGVPTALYFGHRSIEGFQSRDV